MENKSTKETNLLDICISIWNAFVGLCSRLWETVLGMLRITYRRWYIVLTLLILVVVFAFWWYRPSHRKYNAEAMCVLNGPTLEQFEQRYSQLMYANPLSKTDNLWTLLGIDKKQALQIRRMELYKVYDCTKNNVPDIIDYNKSVSPTDTNYVRLEEHVAIGFLFCGDVKSMPVIEQSIIDFLNAPAEFKDQFEVYRATIDRDYQFCHEQIEKLDSMTSSLYFNDYTFSAQSQNGIFQGGRGIALPLEGIREHFEQTYKVDQRRAQAIAPVVLENHFVLKGKFLHDPKKLLVVAVLIGWCIGCLIALLIEQRKEIIAWLKK